MNKSYNHPFHLVTLSPWPLMTSLNLMNMLIGTIKLLNENKSSLILFSLMSLNLCLTLWWRDVIRESTYQGFHTKKIKLLIQLGMILFITSEFFFFLSFFWTYFHSALSPSIEIGSKWPPTMIHPFDPFSTPLLNTIVLLSSGVTITLAHYKILMKNLKKSYQMSMLTILLGMYFTMLQYLEYQESTFTFADSIYGSIFFMITGFHGIHVIIGTLFIMIMMLRIKKYHFSKSRHTGFEASSWYWHFVDLIWLLVYIFIYWWSF